MGLRTWWNPPCLLGLQRGERTYKLPLIKKEKEAPPSQTLKPSLWFKRTHVQTTQNAAALSRILFKTLWYPTVACLSRVAEFYTTACVGWSCLLMWRLKTPNKISGNLKTAMSSSAEDVCTTFTANYNFTVSWWTVSSSHTMTFYSTYVNLWNVFFPTKWLINIIFDQLVCTSLKEASSWFFKFRCQTFYKLA